jgi:isochorismate hydrolase
MVIKERYFSPKHIEEEARTLLNQLPEQKGNRLSQFVPNQSGLLILDMQSYFLEPDSHAFIPSAEAIIPGLESLARAYYAHDLPVIFTQHLNTAQDAGSMSVWWQDLIRAEDPLSAIIPSFDFSNRFVLRKSQYDAFYGTNLEESLRKKRVSQVVISGVMTHLCCETTARSAFIRGFKVFFLVDGTATYNQEHHLATIRNLSHGFAAPVMISELLDIVERDSGVVRQ